MHLRPRLKTDSNRLQLITNMVLYELAWFAIVLGVAWGYVTVGSVIAMALIATHLTIVPDARPEWIRLVWAMAIGAGVESVNLAFEVYTIKDSEASTLLTAPWLLLLWADFSTAFYRSLNWLSNRYALASVAGALGGPVAFWAGERLGAVTLTRHINLLALLSLQWAIALPLLVWISDRLKQRQ